MKRPRRSRSITLAATFTAGLTLSACDYNSPDGARYATYQECVAEFGEDYCEDGRDGFYYSHYYYSGGYVYGYDRRTGKYQIVPRGSGIYSNTNMAPTRALSVRTGGFGSSASGVSLGG
ncbi:hypothetical protein [Calidithermus chliarophilus]|uniref:hypothetical protein n=1 Tax=Calidithermus chliarophilus TaxID=52023 RepID=UPI0003FE0830|nr:hypothetical protein [Calidithermus chliarophilus]